MHHFFVDSFDPEGSEIYITGKNLNHIRNVLRMRPGEQLTVSGRTGGRKFLCRIGEFGPEGVHCIVEDIFQTVPELPVRTVLFQGLPKADKMDFIIEKAVELGVFEIVPVRCSRSVVRLDAKKEANRLARWNGKAEAAAEQCGRTLIPEVTGILSMEEAVSRVSREMEKGLIPYECATDFSATRSAIEGIRPGETVGIFIGPEGGFEKEEVRMAQEAGILPLTLGDRILRTETAGMVVLSWILYNLG